MLKIIGRMRPNFFVDNKDVKAVWKSANLNFRNWLEYPQWCSACDQEIVLLECMRLIWSFQGQVLLLGGSIA